MCTWYTACTFDMNEPAKKPYNKPPLSIDNQVLLLKERGLIVGDESQLKYYLRNISYYHLSVYFKFYQSGDTFIEGITFEDVLRVYTFDNKLRFLLLELLERVEKSFKSRTAYHLSNSCGDSHCHTKKELFKDDVRYNEIQEFFKKVFTDSTEISIDHYRTKYTEPPLPPIWTMVEILSFGQVLKYVRALIRQNQNLIARPLGADAQYILNWMHCLSVLRNICAHHSRLWNREYTLSIKTNHYDYEKFFTNNKKLFNHLIALQIVLNEINPTSSWQEKLVNLIDEHAIDVSYMGFPKDWKEKLQSVRALSGI